MMVLKRASQFDMFTRPTSFYESSEAWTYSTKAISTCKGLESYALKVSLFYCSTAVYALYNLL
jgi:hypothetical protein